MLIRKNIIVLFAFAASHHITQAQTYQTSLDMRVPWIPEVTTIDGVQQAYYELHLTNFGADTLRLISLRVKHTRDSSAVAFFRDSDLQKRFDQPGDPGKLHAPVLAPYQTAVIYLEYNVVPPVQVRHEVVVETSRVGKKLSYAVTGELLDMANKPPLVLGPPLRDGPWTAIYDPAWERGHRRVIYTVDGKARIPGRFAIDFIRVNEKGQYAAHNEDSTANWFGYGNDVLAVARGVVVSVRDDFSESATVSAHAVPPAEKATGNYIALDIGGNHIVFYEHLRPGSIRVKSGQQVRKGDVIAALGFTGQTTGPHLHFHVANRNSPLGAEGVPFVFENFAVLGAYTDLSVLGRQRWTESPGHRTKERPAPNAVIQFHP